MRCYYCHGVGKTEYRYLEGKLESIHSRCYAQMKGIKYEKPTPLPKQKPVVLFRHEVVKEELEYSVPKCTCRVGKWDQACPYTSAEGVARLTV